MKLASQPARRNLLTESAYPNVSTCVQCASITLPSASTPQQTQVPSCHTLADSLSFPKNSSPLQSSKSILFRKNTGVGEGSSSRYSSTDAKRHTSKPFRINTCKSVSKQRTLTTFRMNTCEEQGEGGWLLLTRLKPARSRMKLVSTTRADQLNPRRCIPLPSSDQGAGAVSLRAIPSPRWLGAVGSIDAHVLRSEVASPIPRAGSAGVQVHHNGNMVR